MTGTFRLKYYNVLLPLSRVKIHYLLRGRFRKRSKKVQGLASWSSRKDNQIDYITFCGGRLPRPLVFGWYEVVGNAKLGEGLARAPLLSCLEKWDLFIRPLVSVELNVKVASVTG